MNSSGEIRSQTVEIRSKTVLETPPLPGTLVPTVLDLLEDVRVPLSDPFDLAYRLEGKQITLQTQSPAAPYLIGAQRSFWVINADTNQPFQVQATLGYITNHVYLWVASDLEFNQNHLEALVETFENQIYPTNRAFFGSERTPGIDGDPHLYILYTRGLGSGIAGLFSPGDEYPPQVSEYSNAHEMFLLNADTVRLNRKFTYGVLAHEFQHMIHWYRDRNEESWLNEGFSELAMFLNGYSTSGADYIYSLTPDIQLNNWPANSTYANYGASFLFLTYFLDRFGEQATQMLVGDPENGLVSIDNVLAEIGASDPQTGEPVRADDFYADWVIANFLQDNTVSDGRYNYDNYPEAPRNSDTETIHSCPTEWQTRDVNQYGTDYIRIRCQQGDYVLNFEGSVQVNLLPTLPYSGSYAFWSNKGDEADMTLTRLFDFSDHAGPLTLTYWTWYDIERDYDYAYLMASKDGENWQILITPSGTPEDPSGNSYGWAYNGQSSPMLNDQNPQFSLDPTKGWIHERIDISQFAGQQVYLRFEYITDAATYGEGLLLDDIAIPEIGYFTDFEHDNGGWHGEGFVRIHNDLPQSFRVSLITTAAGLSFGDRQAIKVEHFHLSEDNALSIPIQMGDGIEEIVLVVSGTTRFTREKAAYRFKLTQ